MMTVVFTPLAQSDVADIWDYTLTAWGLNQAITYTENLRDSCSGLADRNVVRRAANVRAGYFKQPCGEHFIFYKESASEITVIRILHKRMDVDRHL